jgi:NAD(P)H-hydrate epimerase
MTADAKTQWEILDRSGVSQLTWYDPPPQDQLSRELDPLITDADWLVDGLLGTGLTRPVEGTVRSVIEAMNQSRKPILALDVPSGLDADSGVPLGAAVRARATATFVAPKLGYSQPGARQYLGEVAVIDIGLPRRLLEKFLA